MWHIPPLCPQCRSLGAPSASSEAYLLHHQKHTFCVPPPPAGAPEPAPASAAAVAATAPSTAGNARAAQPFGAYLAAELHPAPTYPTADLAWGQTERDRVYNALVSVPYQLERFLLFGVAVCLDSFLVGARGAEGGRGGGARPGRLHCRNCWPVTMHLLERSKPWLSALEGAAVVPPAHCMSQALENACRLHSLCSCSK